MNKKLARPKHISLHAYPLGSIESQAAARLVLDNNDKRFRVIVSCKTKPLDLQASTCLRYVCPDGTLFEILEMRGNVGELTEDQLEAFVRKHPISA